MLIHYGSPLVTAENTVIVFLTDNGWIQDPDKPRFAARSKQSPYEGGVRTPILVRWPAKLPQGVVTYLRQAVRAREFSLLTNVRRYRL